MGVTVHAGAGRIDYSIDDVDACGFITGKKTYSWTGGEIEADLCIVCTGATQPSSLYADSGLETWLNEKGQVKVGASRGLGDFSVCSGVEILARCFFFSCFYLKHAAMCVRLRVQLCRSARLCDLRCRSTRSLGAESSDRPTWGFWCERGGCMVARGLA